MEIGRKRRLGAVGEAESLTVGHGNARRPRHARQRLLGQARRGAVLRAAKCLMQCGDDQGAHRLRIAESELGLGRMHVHVDLVGRQREEERKHGMPPVGHEVAVTAAHGAGEKLVAHRPAIDHEMLAEAVGAMERGEAGKALNGKRSARGTHGKRVGHELLAEDAAKPRKSVVEQPRRTRLEPQRGAISGREAESNLRIGEGQALHHIGDGRRSRRARTS